MKILYLDIETKPLKVFTWGIFDTFISPDDIIEDWSVLSWSAKWADEDTVYYQDIRAKADKTDDKQLLKGIWKLLDEADVVIGHNSKSFDVPRLNARFLEHGFQPPSSYKHIDTKKIAKSKFGFTSNALKQLTEKLNKKHRKKEHQKYPGNKLWRECLDGNLNAWKEMEDYNRADVLALEELHTVFAPWSNSLNITLHSESETPICGGCGKTEFQRNGYHYTATGKFQRRRCTNCGAEQRDTFNLFKSTTRSI